MLVDVDVHYQITFDVLATPQQSFDLVADVFRSGCHFPGVDSLVQIDQHGQWCWKLKERGFGPIKRRIQYYAIYCSDVSTQRVTWHPAAKAGDMESSGAWQVSPSHNGGSVLAFETRTVAQFQAPKLMKAMVRSLATEGLTQLKKEYIEAIRQTLNKTLT